MIRDRRNEEGLWLRSFDNKRTFSGAKWSNMCNRCKVGGAYQARNPTYVGCTMSELFKDFQSFTDWHVSQVGYGLPSYEIDKDILNSGNKLYSEETCVLLPHDLNTFFRSSRGEMAGAFFDKRRNQIYSKIVTSVGQKRLGTFMSHEDAAQCYQAAKRKEANNWVSRIMAGEYLVDSRVIERLKNW